MTDNAREKLRQTFLAAHRWHNADATPLTPDASFRCYTRLRRKPAPAKAGGDGDRHRDGDGHRALLMDAPPPEDVAAFVAITVHLARLNIRAPKIYAADIAHGFLLLEDLGDATYTNLLAAGYDETELYRGAVKMLTHIKTHAHAADVNLPPYDDARMLAEAILLPDWYVPARHGRAVSAAARKQYAQLWRDAIAALPPLAPTLVLRDFHCDNLMRVSDDDGNDDGNDSDLQNQFAPLDYQDAVIGSPAYDLMSLLEDARRDVSAKLTALMLNEYLHATKIPRADFQQHYIVWAAQRHCKVAGIFVRLWLRDGKDVYLHHLPRVMKLLQRNLEQPALHPLRDWLAEHLGDINHPADFSPSR